MKAEVETAARKGPGRMRAALVGLAAGLAALLALEGLLRLRSGDDKAFSFESNFAAISASKLLIEHDQRFYTLRPKRRVTDEHAGRYACDEWPFRGRAPAPPGLERWPADTRHILVLGDSCVFGQGLDIDQSLPARIASELGVRGYPRSRVQVTNLGVPGYSCIQIERLLTEFLDEAQPVAVVLYPGAWNDQAVALAKSDVELVRAAKPLFAHSAIARLLASRAGTSESDEEVSRARSAAFEAGDPDVPRRVELADYLEGLARIEAACGERSVELIVIAPGHPAKTAERFPMVRTYAEQTLAWAERVRAPSIDAQSVLADTGLSDETLFLDFVHPSPPAVGAIAARAVELIVPALGPAEPRGAPPSGWTLSRSTASTLGDEWLELHSAAIDGVEGPLLVSVGEAPLLDMERTANGGLRGRTLANSPGAHSVLVWIEGGWRDTGTVLELVEPQLELQAEADLRLIARSRPGDRFIVRVAPSLRSSPRWTPQGPFWLDDDKLLPNTFELTCDEHGRAVLDLESFRPRLTEPLFAQAVVLPVGAPQEDSLARLSSVAKIALGRRD